MKRLSFFIVCLMLAAPFITCPARTFAEPGKSIQLPAPQTDGGKPLMQALKDRSSGREFSTENLPLQVLSDLLWAACGINRPDSGKRTAPSAKDFQEIDVYAAMIDGLYRYDAEKNTLKLILAEDIRAFTGKQRFAADAPVNLVYVADFSKVAGDTELEKTLYAGADTGFISQNVYLFCASQGLATVVRGYVDKPALEKKMGLKPHQKVILAQTVGYPKK
ncbi:MAG: SagB/ThcOx family dehydrogenase [Desulfobacteraceae bacterium]|nr:MAG: SagB/ThcOx family dehydrogenase [Desulfobacteraceae bacterium]